MNAILENSDVISKMRGKWHEVIIEKSKIFTIVSFHPAYLLRQPDQKKFSWEDLKKIRDKIKNLNIKIEKKINLIAGVDEVGRGCLAGPVVSAAVIIKKGARLSDVKDSKKNCLF